MASYDVASNVYQAYCPPPHRHAILNYCFLSQAASYDVASNVCRSLAPGRHLLSHRGRAVQVDPVKPKLKLPGIKRLKLKCHVLLSSFAFKFKLRRYTAVDSVDDVLTSRAADLRPALLVAADAPVHHAGVAVDCAAKVRRAVPNVPVLFAKPW